MDSEPATFLGGRITIDPAVCDGNPTIRGKRIAAPITQPAPPLCGSAGKKPGPPPSDVER